tara:strand:- start:39 stop:413 length:375 start_codon:yes stop_codon:yes gene_type:complete
MDVPASLTTIILVIIKANAIKPTIILIALMKLACFPVQKRAINRTIKKIEITGPLRKEIEVFTDIHSIVTSATTPITPIHEETMETSNAVIMKMVTGFPNAFLKLNISVSPETIVNLLIEIRRK